MVWVVQCFQSQGTWPAVVSWPVYAWMQSWLLQRAVGGWSGWSGEQCSLCEKQKAQPAHQVCLAGALASGCNAEGWRWNSRNGCCLRKLPPERDVGLEVRLRKKRLLRKCWSWPGRETEDEQDKTLPKEVRFEPTQGREELWGKSGFRCSRPKDLHWNPEVSISLSSAY